VLFVVGAGAYTCEELPEMCVLGTTGDLGEVSDCGLSGPNQYDCCAYMSLGCTRGDLPVGSSCTGTLDCAPGNHCHCGSTRRRTHATRRGMNRVKGKGRRLFGAPAADYSFAPPSPPSCHIGPGTCMANVVDELGSVINGHGLCC
jgi:hypothetical protein